ncbi:hypothetical protein [Kaistia algarum]|nr:hypothetical protein [Kaistia algarum]MCX5516203.1 hypothetical protein [Kaistia algarum]
MSDGWAITRGLVLIVIICIVALAAAHAKRAARIEAPTINDLQRGPS